MKGIAESLSASGQVISDEDLLGFILDGLGPEFDAVIVNLTSRIESKFDNSVTLQEAQYLLQNISPLHDQFHASANIGQYGVPYQHFRPSGFSSFGRGRGRGNLKGKPICQVCNKIGHTVVQCYHRYNSHYNGSPPPFGSQVHGGYPGGIGLPLVNQHINTSTSTYPPNSSFGGHQKYETSGSGYQQQQQSVPNFNHTPSVFTIPSQQTLASIPSQAYFAAPHPLPSLNPGFSLTSIQDLAWYMDSDATDHFTADLNQLSVSRNYDGTEQLLIGSGEFLNISYVGFSLLPSTLQSKSLYLKNVLCVPRITKNLLSISKFTKVNNVVEFSTHCCVVKDKVTNQVLL
ncbi:uncharacterized protein LOC116139755 [Pistacia vera]|uniref:uncharacterized protein LOC116139755 n=1 Tax=Pistacia vera TaxID=55513 RepID=UPI001262B3C2|nr:uncharacterized protein LOC116139755 [Pistacia vera]